MIEIILIVIAFISFSSAIIFGTAGIVGLFRFPDPYSRLQAGSLCGTTAVFSIFIGALALAPNWAMAARIIIVAFFFLLSSPTGTHIVARFAWNSGTSIWKPKTEKKNPDVDRIDPA
ncbi:monovalent cation/H(+) antiporter subunit G [Oceanispirochaeta sp.]|jgi:multicomponent Na+:H+ antiporter subunit G|uniref:monovalent cation/H(+) antiporter subunit G n=1 Tax=Oceanispirochaeta sp. TaxID=2035350 RepID=UPI002635B01F|nr:monovalent cation/H(+) antiporter subunit G [Oceanispirochaeta sp.]MDA3957081.1 monovalent cation/H(+) antiporter subunit G [Oceanispirochaeta sp.]